MAIYQFHLTVIPKKGILEKFGHIPEILEIDYEERKEHYYLKEDNLIEDEDEFIDAMTQDWWSTTELNPMEIIHQIDKKVKRANYGDETFINWKTYSKEVDNDAVLSINKETGKIEELTFRADLRENGFLFLKEILRLAKNHDWLLMDIKGNLANPELQEIKKLIKKSNTFKFLENPLKFLTNLGEE